MGITFDGSITLGAIINAAALLVGFVVAFTRIGGRIDLLALRVEGLEKAISNTEGIDNRQATIEERVNNHVSLIVNTQNQLNDLRNEVTRLRRGEGWVTSH